MTDTPTFMFEGNSPPSTVARNGSVPIATFEAFRPATTNDAGSVVLTTKGMLISTAEIYPDSEVISPQLGAALRLLKEASEYFEEALANMQEGAAIGADTAIQRVIALLPELFTLTSMSDGFRAVVLGCYHSLINLEGQLASHEQVQALKVALIGTRNRAFLNFRDAMAILARLREAKLNPNARFVDAAIAEAVSSDID